MESVVVDSVAQKIRLGLNEERVERDEFYEGDDPLLKALRKASKSLEGAAKEAGMPNVEDFEEYFFKEFRPNFLEKWKKEKGHA